MKVWLTTSKTDHELLSKNLGFRMLAKKEILIESQNVFRTQSVTKSTLQKWKFGNNNKKLRKMQKSKAFGLVQFFIFLNFLSNLLFRIVSRNKFWLLEFSSLATFWKHYLHICFWSKFNITKLLNLVGLDFFYKFPIQSRAVLRNLNHY